MRVAVMAGACAALLAAGARADAPVSPPFDIDDEIAWARANWPGAFDGLHFHAPLAKLRAWVAHGPIPVYLFNDDFACRAATLLPPEDEGATQPQPMMAKIVGRPRMDDGRLVREIKYVAVDFELSGSDDGLAFEARGEDGRWRAASASGYGIPPTIYGALSSADARVARWGGAAQAMRPYCSGPVEWLACAAGGERPCVRCEEVRVTIAGTRVLSGSSVSQGSRPVTCHDACPQFPESPRIKRLRILLARSSLWIAEKRPLSAVPSLYKSREDCLREHPQVDRSRKR